MWYVYEGLLCLIYYRCSCIFVWKLSPDLVQVREGEEEEGEGRGEK